MLYIFITHFLYYKNNLCLFSLCDILFRFMISFVNMTTVSILLGEDVGQITIICGTESKLLVVLLYGENQLCTEKSRHFLYVLLVVFFFRMEQIRI